METKKNPEKDLTKQRGLFLSIGFIISISLMLSAFEWTSQQKPVNAEEVKHSNYEEQMEEMLVEKIEQPKPVLVQPEIIEIEDELQEDTNNEISFNSEENNNTQSAKIEIPKGTKLEEEIVKEPDFVWVAPVMPEPQGGFAGFYKFLQKELRYPDQARRMGIEGKVYIEFIVEKDGSLSNMKVIKSVGGGCDEEALRVLKKSPKWTPGNNAGRGVRVRMSLPVNFKLN